MVIHRELNVDHDNSIIALEHCWRLRDIPSTLRLLAAVAALFFFIAHVTTTSPASRTEKNMSGSVKHASLNLDMPKYVS